MTVNTRAIDLRTVLLSTESNEQQHIHIRRKHSPLGELRRRATSNLLYPKTQELCLQLSKLLRQVILGPSLERHEYSDMYKRPVHLLGLELVRLDLAGHFVV